MKRNARGQFVKGHKKGKKGGKKKGKKRNKLRAAARRRRRDSKGRFLKGKKHVGGKKKGKKAARGGKKTKKGKKAKGRWKRIQHVPRCTICRRPVPAHVMDAHYRKRHGGGSAAAAAGSTVSFTPHQKSYLEKLRERLGAKKNMEAALADRAEQDEVARNMRESYRAREYGV